MTVCFLISSEGYYGIENMLVTLARSLSELGVRCVVGVLRDARFPHVEVAEQASKAGLAVEIIPCTGRLCLSSVRHLRKVLIKHDVDVLHPHGYKADVYAYLAALHTGTALLATVHNWPSKLLSMRTYAAVDRVVLRRFDKVIAVSEVVRGVLERSGVPSRKMSLICNGVDIERYRTGDGKLRKDIARNGDLTVGFAGRLVADKGGRFLIGAAPRVLSTFPKTTFVLIGEGPARSEWETMASDLGVADHVVFTGARDDMPAVYASLDVVVLPSLVESMPMSLLEAMAAGRPVIATRVGAIPTVITSGQTGLLVEPGDGEALAAAICELLADRESATRIGENGRAHVTAQFSARSMAQKYVAEYQEVLGTPNRWNKVAFAGASRQ